MADSAVSVQVALRIRPLVKSEISKGYVKCLETVPNKPQVLIKNLSFTYNHVFPPEVSQAEFYDTAVKGLVDGLFKGYNVTILAYGQTGSGKTHSMGMAYSVGPVEEMGVIPRAVSFMELYQEQLFDLLSKSNRDQSIVDIREDQQKRIVIPGLTEIEVRNAKDTLDCLVRGYRRRAVGATAMNSQSKNQDQQDNHLSQQAALTTGLQQLNKELAWKRTLVAQVAQKVNMPIPEPKYAPKDLFDMIADPRRSVDAHKERGTELENQLTEAVAKVAQCQQEMDKLREQHRHELAELMTYGNRNDIKNCRTPEKKAKKMKKRSRSS
ncbi:chromosome-associated kinesin KIF4-like [Ctenocephalides felis]|uniref:chromosome-associated kinesin KIF4-like n=1 Tax=Ctenocephalides felis TaxID=7515 RepID=UPI000E6E11B2|nr:chromosome-associated kinesin KIF4-like [Ctenocephalides felis]